MYNWNLTDSTLTNYILQLRKPLWLLIILYFLSNPVLAGNCWVRMGKNGRCQKLILANVSREECCRIGHEGMAWSSVDLSSSKLFYYMALAGGAPNCETCQDSCENVKCEEGKRCRMRRKQPKCVCAPRCKLRHKGPVCGTDGRNYRNHCSMLKYNCRHAKNVEIAYFGKCQKSCKNVKCVSNLKCVVDQNETPHCVYCSIHCPPAQNKDEKVCGADGVTYESSCALRAATCNLGRTIGIAYSGPCRDSVTCDNLTCAAGKKCLVHPQTNRPQCVTCNMTCTPLTHRPRILCGSDNKTYANWCKLRRHACHTGTVIKAKHQGRCGKDRHSSTTSTSPNVMDFDDHPSDGTANHNRRTSLL